MVSFVDSLKRAASAIHSKEQAEIVTPRMRCRRIPYTSSKEKASATSVHQVIMCSTEHVPIKEKDSDGTSPINLTNVPNKDPESESNAQNNPAQTEWLDSVPSKMSNNVDSTTSNYPNTFTRFLSINE